MNFSRIVRNTLQNKLVITSLIIFILCVIGFFVLRSYQSGTSEGQAWPFGGDASENTVIEAKVKGLDYLPAYPGSTFMFADDLDKPEVLQMLANKKSAYHLPRDTQMEEVLSFYKEKLAEQGWQFDHEVPRFDPVQKQGYYWIKESRGLRIYQVVNDIWYEEISAEEASAGLADVLAEENREYFLQGQPVKLSSFVQTYWDVEFPDTWEVANREAIYSNGLDVEFDYSLGGLHLEILDLGKDFGSNLTEVAEYYYFVDHTKRLPVEDRASDSESPQKKETKVGELSALEMVYSPVGRDGAPPVRVVFVQHPENLRYFAIVNDSGEKDLYELLLLELRPI